MSTREALALDCADQQPSLFYHASQVLPCTLFSQFDLWSNWGLAVDLLVDGHREINRLERVVEANCGSQSVRGTSADGMSANWRVNAARLG